MTPTRRPSGYTLVEMLAALLVLGLAMTALVQTTRTFAQTSRRTSATMHQVGLARATETFLRRELGPGPFVSAADGSEAVLQGTEQRLLYDCGAAEACVLAVRDTPSPRLEASGGRSVPLPAPGLRFRYLSSDATRRRFPEGDQGPLREVALVDPLGAPFAVWRAAVQQSADCAFDEVNHRCFPSPAPGPR